jgi:hypothetical protein
MHPFAWGRAFYRSFNAAKGMKQSGVRNCEPVGSVWVQGLSHCKISRPAGSAPALPHSNKSAPSIFILGGGQKRHYGHVRLGGLL